jgi:hypothetical protein
VVLVERGGLASLQQRALAVLTADAKAGLLHFREHENGDGLGRKGLGERNLGRQAARAARESAVSSAAAVLPFS